MREINIKKINKAIISILKIYLEQKIIVSCNAIAFYTIQSTFYT